MSGEELKQYIKRSGLTMSDVARELGTTPQNVQARLGRKTIKIDFIQKITVIGSNVNGSNSSNVSQSIGSDAALAAENKLLREQNEFLQNQVKTLLAIVGQK